MNEIYAFDPDEIGTRELNKLTIEFQTSKGRFVGGFPLDWRRTVSRKLALDPSNFNQRLLTRLEKWSGYIEVQERYLDKLPWVENALKVQREKRIFEKVFSGKEKGYEVTESIDDLVNDQIVLEPSHETYIKPEATQYGKICRPLFMMSEEVVLWDYKFCTRFTDKFSDEERRDNYRLDVFREILLTMLAVNRTRRFLLVLNKKEVERFDIENIKKDLYDEKARVDPDSKIEFQIDLDDGQYEGISSGHPRCIFSMRGGLRFDQGFQVLRNVSGNLVSWMTDEALKPFRAKYIPKFHSFSSQTRR